MNLTTFIEPLLLSSDFVVVPDFGAFIGNVHGARVHNLSNKIYPPSKQISFNSKLTQNDGLLANYISNEQGISYEDALSFIASEANLWRASLNAGQKVQIKNVGSLQIDSNGAMRFDPSNERNFYLDSFGLMPIALQEIKKEKPLAEKVERTTEPVNRKVAPEKSQIKYRIPKLVYAFLAFPLALYLLWLSTQTNLFREERFLISDLNPFQTKICQTYSVRESVSEIIQIPESKNNVSLLLSEDIESNFVGVSFKEQKVFPNEKKGFFVRMREAFVASPITTSVSINTRNESMRYHLIAGCFSQKSNAERMVRKMSKAGFNASIIDQRSGLYRVSAASFARKDEALATIETIRSDYVAGTWLLIK